MVFLKSNFLADSNVQQDPEPWGHTEGGPQRLDPTAQIMRVDCPQFLPIPAASLSSGAAHATYSVAIPESVLFTSCRRSLQVYVLFLSFLICEMGIIIPTLCSSLGCWKGASEIIHVWESTVRNIRKHFTRGSYHHSLAYFSIIKSPIHCIV